MDQVKIDNVRYQAQFPDRFRDDESSDEFNTAAGQTCKKFKLKFKFWRFKKWIWTSPEPFPVTSGL